MKMTKQKKWAWILFGAWFILISLMMFAALASARPAAAAPDLQVTETPTPTPETSDYYVLSSGNAVRVDRSVSYGQIWIVGAVLAAVLVLTISLIFRVVVHYLR